MLTGKQIKKYDNGTTKSIIFYKNGKRDSIATWFYPDGMVEIHGFYRDGKKVGDLFFYYPNGKIKSYNFISTRGHTIYKKMIDVNNNIELEDGTPFFVASNEDFKNLPINKEMFFEIVCANPPYAYFDLSVGIQDDNNKIETIYKKRIHLENPTIKLFSEEIGKKKLVIMAHLIDTLAGVDYRDTIFYDLNLVE